MGSSWRRSAFTCRHPQRLITGSGMGDLSQGPRTIKAGARTLYRRGEPIGTSRLAPGLSQKRYRDGRFGCAGARPVMWVKVSLPLDHEFGHPAIATWIEADPTATVARPSWLGAAVLSAVAWDPGRCPASFAWSGPLLGRGGVHGQTNFSL
jgi:hypothetical protein